MAQIPIKFDCCAIKDEEKEGNLVYYEAENGMVQTLDGILENVGDDHVLSERMTKRTRIKEGQILGYVFSMVIGSEEEDNKDEDWTMDRIAEEVKLGEELTEEERKKVHQMLMEVNEALSKGDNDIGIADVNPHRIETTQETPIWLKARNFSQPINDEIHRQCEELLLNDVLEYSNSPWSAPVVPVRKTDGSLRLCVDYRQLNKVTKKENFPMPNLTSSIYKPRNVKFFSKIDLVRGYYQVPIHEESRPYTAFTTAQEHYQFKRLSFGLKNSGMAFQRVMQQILAPVLNQNIVVYIDDILIMSETFEEHILLVEKVLTLLRKSGIKVKVSKCEMFKSETNFLGHVISSEGIRKSPEYIESVRMAKKPETITDMRKFLGLVNFQRKFVANCSILTKPLSDWTSGAKSKKIIWSQEMDVAYLKLKEEIAKDVMLAYPSYEKDVPKMELYVDASGTGTGACLMQKLKGEYKVIGYASKTFSDTQRRYNATDRELAALRWGIINFRGFLAGVPFILVTDHKPLIYLNNMAVTNSRLMRTVTELAEYEFEIKYRPGVDNEAADFLSRLNDGEPRYEEVVDHKYLPKELKKLCDVPGGGDSMFESIWLALKESKENEDYKGDLPESYDALRNTVVEELSTNMKEYGLCNSKQVRQKLKQMKLSGQQPVPEVLLAASKLFSIRVLVYCGMKTPIIFEYKESLNTTIRLQCVSMIHYN